MSEYKHTFRSLRSHWYICFWWSYRANRPYTWMPATAITCFVCHCFDITPNTIIWQNQYDSLTINGGRNFKRTYARGLRATPSAVILAVSPGRAHQDKRRVAGEGDRGEVGESSVLSLPLGWHSWVSTENSCKDQGERNRSNVRQSINHVVFEFSIFGGGGDKMPYRAYCPPYTLWQVHVRDKSVTLTEALGFLSTPVARALAC